jgi:hypothetical protein
MEQQLSERIRCGDGATGRGPGRPFPVGANTNNKLNNAPQASRLHWFRARIHPAGGTQLCLPSARQNDDDAAPRGRMHAMSLAGACGPAGRWSTTQALGPQGHLAS